MHTILTHSAAKAGLFARVTRGVRALRKGLDFMTPLGDLAIRLWAANVFWKSGMVKFQSFDSTLLLFQYEYSVPLLPPDVAAYLSTFSELFFSALLALGLGGRLGAAMLFLVNIVAVISYPELTDAGREQHYLWGLLLLACLLHGPGKLSIDHLIASKLGV